MGTVPLKLITIVGETVLSDRLIEAVKSLGAKGYTMTETRGEGSRHRRAGEIPGQNIKLETVVPAAVADAILDYVAREYFSDYAVIAYVTDVAVVRGGKYV